MIVFAMDVDAAIPNVRADVFEACTDDANLVVFGRSVCAESPFAFTVWLGAIAVVSTSITDASSVHADVSSVIADVSSVIADVTTVHAFFGYVGNKHILNKIN